MISVSSLHFSLIAANSSSVTLFFAGTVNTIANPAFSATSSWTPFVAGPYGTRVLPSSYSSCYGLIVPLR